MARSSSPSSRDGVEHRERGRAATGLPPNVVPCAPGSSRSAASPKASSAPIGRPPPSPLARVMTSGCDAVGLVGEPGAGAADAGLHLVERRAARRRSRGGRRGRGQVAGRRRDDAALAQDRLEQHHRRSGRSTAAAQRVDVAVRHVAHAAGQRLERRAAWRLAGERQRAHGAAVEGALGGDDLGPAGAAG